MLEFPPLTLYVHLPWCVRKCPYCDFNSHEATGELPQADYVAALCEDLDEELAMDGSGSPREFQSLFIGGGTPSLFDAAVLEKLLRHIDSTGRLAAGAEITLEANPGTAEMGRFREFRAIGINRLSLGIQSFNDAQLQGLGRIHDGREARAAIHVANAAGFDNLNLDLMHGLPGQSVSDALADLDTALGFAPAHLSWYQLTIEPNTHFWSRPPVLPQQSVLEAIHEAGVERLAAGGYRRYEVSAWAQPGRECRHNLNYWQFGDYLGIGAGASGKRSDPSTNRIVRTRKSRQPLHYLHGNVNRRAEVVAVTKEERPLEYLLNALRLKRGFRVADFERRTGVPFQVIAERIDSLRAMKLLSVTDSGVRATGRGYRLLDSLLQEFLRLSQVDKS